MHKNVYKNSDTLWSIITISVQYILTFSCYTNDNELKIDLQIHKWDFFIGNYKNIFKDLFTRSHKTINIQFRQCRK